MWPIWIAIGLVCLIFIAVGFRGFLEKDHGDLESGQR
jgi:hypothetical protein